MTAAASPDSATQYLLSTRSAVIHLFSGIQAYRDMLRAGMVKGPGVDLRSMAPEVREAVVAIWQDENADDIEEGFAWQRRHYSERFAKAALCGAVFDIAKKGLELHSRNTQVPRAWQSFFSGDSARYCVGTSVRGVPRGLIVYAARNQAAHYNDGPLHKRSQAVFDHIAFEHGMPGFDTIKDPGFDLGKRPGESYAASMLALLGWQDADSYQADMCSMLDIAAVA